MRFKQELVFEFLLALETGKHVQESKFTSMTVKTSCCVVGEKESFLDCERFCVSLEGLDLVGLVGTDRVRVVRTVLGWFLCV